MHSFSFRALFSLKASCTGIKLGTAIIPFLQMFFVCQIEKYGDPNGIVQFSEDALRERVYNESTEAEGPLNISYLIMRREGVMGNITVWSYLKYTFTVY